MGYQSFDFLNNPVPGWVSQLVLLILLMVSINVGLRLDSQRTHLASLSDFLIQTTDQHMPLN